MATANLIISAIGDRSVHSTWISGPERPDFDLFLIYYGDLSDFAKSDATFYVRRKGFKWEHIHFAIDRLGDALNAYERIWCPDDDIACDTANVNLLFEIFERYQLQLAQPAVSRGQFSFKGLAQRRGKILRYSPYVEVMCPIFTRSAIQKVQHTFLENRSGWGIDWIWPRHFAENQIAVIDKVGVHHTGQLGKGENYQNLASLGIDPAREFEDTVGRHGGFDRQILRRMLHGWLRMRSIKDPDDNRTVWKRIADEIRWLRLRRGAA
ncbi:MAG TPA: hypothetical protein VMW56_17865 [Candidatus Margulisiibacteriota bacterium]|nr:hypothetical protein [Candidatus Margulisiibacteriota bacterium]